MSLHSLESERNAILNRMQMSRSGYRHMLGDDEDEMHAAAADLRTASPSGSPHHPAYVDSHVRHRFPRSATMKLLTRHPFACALAVAAVVVIGPRRIMRTALKSGPAVTALTLRNPANVDMISRVLALVGQQVAQRTRARHTQR
jgi:hypothetical protein